MGRLTKLVLIAIFTGAVAAFIILAIGEVIEGAVK